MRDWLNSKKEQAMNAISRVQNKEFKEGLMASLALVATADGAVTSEEKSKICALIQNCPQLKGFDTQELIKTFQRYVSGIELDNSFGRQICDNALEVISKPSEAKLLITTCTSVAKSDGDFSKDEGAEIARIKKLMGVRGI